MDFETIQHNASNSIVTIEKGELVSFQHNNEELMHQKGDPGWQNTDTEMFPIIGPTVQNNYRVDTPNGECIQDQHGLLRLFEYKILHKSENTISFIKEYKANTPIKNLKFPNTSPEAYLSWPYNFTFVKNYELNEKGLLVSFEFKAEEGMPFMLGYHPNFKLSGSSNEYLETVTKRITVQDVLDVGDTALPILNTTEIRLVKKSGYDVKIMTKGFENFMLWTPVPNMLCIEPITAYPLADGGLAAGKIFSQTKNRNLFEVLISPI